MSSLTWKPRTKVTIHGMSKLPKEVKELQLHFTTPERMWLRIICKDGQTVDSYVFQGSC